MGQKNLYINIGDVFGFSLLEIIIAIVILCTTTCFTISISSAINNTDKTLETKNRMKLIETQIKEFYKNYGTLPDFINNNNMIIDKDNLNPGQMYGTDIWGRPFYYHPGNSITSVVVNRSNGIAGYILSSGPNRTMDTDVLSDPDNILTRGDDIVVQVNVSNQAIEAARLELSLLQNKVHIFDTISKGIDPDQGAAALDSLPNEKYGFKNMDALSFITDRYNLPSEYQTDPWGHYYVWGNAGLGKKNPRYHKFFSPGLDGVIGNADDIIP